MPEERKTVLSWLVPAAARFPLSIIPKILIAFGLLLAGYGIGQFAGAATPIKPPAAAGGTPDAAQLQKQIEEVAAYRDNLKDRLDLISQQGTHALWLLSAVLVVAGFLTAAQSYFALLSAENYVRQAKEVMDGIQKQFPMFAEIETARVQAFDELSKLTPPALDLDQNLYAKSDPLFRQRILALESFSAIQFLTPATRGEERGRNLRLLGKLYAGKFSSDGQQPITSDFDRALYYFNLATYTQLRFAALNDLAWLYTSVARPENDPVSIDKGRAYSEESLRAQPAQQRALYNLGTIAYERNDRQRLLQARDYLLRAKQQPIWEDTAKPALASHIDYNLACVCDSLAAFAPDATAKEALFHECADYLRRAAVHGAQPPTTVNTDLATGDLSNLGNHVASAAVVTGIRALYQAAWDRAA